ncbi:MAG: dipeptide ABC transporter ATP-binding protein [Hyphomonadaceae bacterium]
MTESSARQPILDVRDLSVSFETPDGRVEAVKKLSFDVARGECLGLVGESGSGKSQTVLAAMGLTAKNGIVEGSIKFDGVDLTTLSRKQLNEIRGAKIGMIFQDPLTSLTPHMTVGAQMAEVLARHKNLKGRDAEQRIVEWLERVRIPEARRRLHQFPHELSGGMRQRVMIASAMLCEPEVLLADEPTTALDVTVQAQVLDLMDELKRETGAGLVLITHDMGVIARMADRVVVMRHGEAVERGNASELFAAPKHPYTRMLLEAMPRLDRADRGDRPNIGPPPPVETAPPLEVKDLHVTFPVQVPGGFFGKRVPLRAVDGVSFNLRAGETMGVVGESGCGKSTLARGVLRLLDPSAGSVAWLGRDIAKASRKDVQPLRQELQVVFQDPLASLDPRTTIGQSISEPLTVFRPDVDAKSREAAAREMMERMGLDPSLVNRYPHELSGGQNQRVGIARAMILRPKLVVCDEAVSALDVSVQAQILDLLIDLQKEFGLAMMFISHDLSVIREICHRVMVLYLGRVVEMAPRDVLFERPQHPYTQALLSAVPSPDPARERGKARIKLVGDLPSPLDPKASLRFMKSKLTEDGPFYRPQLVEVAPGHWVAEHDPVEAAGRVA